MGSDEQVPAFLKSKFPVSFPSHPALFYPPEKFEAFLQKDLIRYQRPDLSQFKTVLPLRVPEDVTTDVSDAEVSALGASADVTSSTWAQVANTGMDSKTVGSDDPFMKALFSHDATPDLSKLPDNKMLTENRDIAHRSTTSALVDLFFELEEVVAEDRLHELLKAAWDENDLMTLKILFNARSIHLGKSSRKVFYRSLDWLSIHHPLTCILSLQWLPRPVIEKKVEKKDGGEDEVVFVEPEKGEDDPTRFDVRNGVAHGYYKDLVNILALAVNRKLNDPSAILNVQTKKHEIVWDAGEAAGLRHGLRDERHENAVKAFHNDPFYRSLHLMVARIFAEQLKADLKLLRSGDKKALRQISLCGKWAPSSKLFHDKHTFIVSSIAELLHSQDEFKGVESRDEYLKHAREAYRKDISALRKQLEIVERDISANNFQNIKYERIPSLAMSNYNGIFVEKDEDRFNAYLDDVASGKKIISGATLLPSTLVRAVRAQGRGFSHATYATRGRGRGGKKKHGLQDIIAAKQATTHVKVMNSQWKTLVKRIKDSGTLQSSIAVCDVSGSMGGPVFSDGTTPMDSAIGLSLLLAEVCEPPFGGAFITFSTRPKVVKLDLNKPFDEKVRGMERADWGQSTNFMAVFEDLILPMAVENKLKQEDMVKQIFVFSDMQFDQAIVTRKPLSTVYERLQAKYAEHGYEMPQLIFWNLAGGRAGYNPGGYGMGTRDSTAPKPVLANEIGTAMVSGYSQGMLKVFLENGSFDDLDEGTEEELIEKEETTEDGDEITLVETVKKRKMDPLSTVKKAISHKAYDMFKVVD